MSAVNQIQVAMDRMYRVALVNTVVIFRAPYKARKFLISQEYKFFKTDSAARC
jgi:hypothetical protein